MLYRSRDWYNSCTEIQHCVSGLWSWHHMPCYSANESLRGHSLSCIDFLWEYVLICVVSEFAFDPSQWPRAVMDEDFAELSSFFKADKSIVRVLGSDPNMKMAVLASWQVSVGKTRTGCRREWQHTRIMLMVWGAFECWFACRIIAWSICCIDGKKGNFLLISAVSSGSLLLSCWLKSHYYQLSLGAGMSLHCKLAL